jgi:hypothetical protein
VYAVPTAAKVSRMSNPGSPATPPPAQQPASQPAGSGTPSGGPPASQPAAAPTPPPRKPALTDAEISARSTKHAAWVAAGAAILAAILSIGGAYWSAERAARSASETVSKQVSGETEKSRAEFLRAKRQELYSKVIADEGELSQMENEILKKAYENSQAKVKPAPPKSLDDFLRPLDSKRKSLERDRSVIDILASDGVRDAYSKLVDLRDIQHNELFLLTMCSLIPNCDFDAEKKDYLEEEAAYLWARGQLTRAARHDMGSE